MEKREFKSVKIEAMKLIHVAHSFLSNELKAPLKKSEFERNEIL